MMHKVLEFTQSWFSELTGLVSQGSKRVFVGYLLSAAHRCYLANVAAQA